MQMASEIAPGARKPWLTLNFVLGPSSLSNNPFVEKDTEALMTVLEGMCWLKRLE